MTSERSEIEALALRALEDAYKHVGHKAPFPLIDCAKLIARLLQPARVPESRLIGWRSADYTMETDDPDMARNWAGNIEVLPIFEGDPNTKLAAAPAAEGGKAWESPFGSCVCEGQNQCPGCNPNEAIKMAAEIATADERAKHPPCMECGAKTAKEAETMCHCSGDKDDCHGCQLWPDVEATPAPESRGAPKCHASATGEHEESAARRDWCDACGDEFGQQPEAGQREGVEITGKVNGYLPRQRAIEIKLDGEIPQWMTAIPPPAVKISQLTKVGMLRDFVEEIGPTGKPTGYFDFSAKALVEDMAKKCGAQMQHINDGQPGVQWAFTAIGLHEFARRLASAQQAGNPWDSIISEIQRRAESEGADERGSDFTVTISIGEYRKAMRTGSRGEGE